MKVEQDKKVFAVLTITIETQDELDQLASLCNFSPIYESLLLIRDIRIGLKDVEADKSGAHFKKISSRWEKD